MNIKSSSSTWQSYPQILVAEKWIVHEKARWTKINKSMKKKKSAFHNGCIAKRAAWRHHYDCISLLTNAGYCTMWKCHQHGNVPNGSSNVLKKFAEQSDNTVAWYRDFILGDDASQYSICASLVGLHAGARHATKMAKDFFLNEHATSFPPGRHGFWRMTIKNSFSICCWDRFHHTVINFWRVR
jgi:hypothetical protein